MNIENDKIKQNRQFCILLFKNEEKEEDEKKIDSRVILFTNGFSRIIDDMSKIIERNDFYLCKFDVFFSVNIFMFESLSLKY